MITYPQLWLFDSAHTLSWALGPGVHLLVKQLQEVLVVLQEALLKHSHVLDFLGDDRGWKRRGRKEGVTAMRYMFCRQGTLCDKGIPKV